MLFDQVVNKSESSRIVGTGVQAKVESSTINIFRTRYFQFQTSRSWREITEETSDTRFVYRGFKENLVEHQLVIEVDDISDDVHITKGTTRAYPFEIGEEGRVLPVADVSEHCGTLEEGIELRPTRTEYHDTTFPCIPDGTSYIVALTKVGGSEVFTHVGADGVERTLRITYQNSAFTPSPTILRSIVSTLILL